MASILNRSPPNLEKGWAEQIISQGTQGSSLKYWMMAVTWVLKGLGNSHLGHPSNRIPLIFATQWNVLDGKNFGNNPLWSSRFNYLGKPGDQILGLQRAVRGMQKPRVGSDNFGDRSLAAILVVPNIFLPNHQFIHFSRGQALEKTISSKMDGLGWTFDLTLWLRLETCRKFTNSVVPCP